MPTGVDVVAESPEAQPLIGLGAVRRAAALGTLRGVFALGAALAYLLAIVIVAVVVGAVISSPV